MRYMEVLMDQFKTHSDKTALIDPATDRYMTYGELDEVTSKVYSYRLMLGRDEFGQILSTPGKKGYARTKLHDALYAIYTSGTTGKE